MRTSDLINQLGGSHTLESLGGLIGLERGQTESMVDALAPMLIRGLQHRTSSDQGLNSFRDALATGKHHRYIDHPSSARSDEIFKDGTKILGHIFGDERVNQNVAAEASKRTGIDMSMVEKALPAVASLVMAAMSKKSSAGQELAQTQAHPNPLGSLASLFDQNQDGQVLDDIIGMAGRFMR